MYLYVFLLGECVEDCPTEKPEVACLTEPIFPDWVDATDGEDYLNFTTTYVQGSGDVTREVRNTHLMPPPKVL